MYTERHHSLASLVHSYDSSEEDEQPTSTQPTQSAAPPPPLATFEAIRPTTASNSPPLSLDRQVQQFVSAVSGLASEVEEDEAGQRRLSDTPSMRLYSHIDRITGRPYYFDSTRQLRVWQPPTVGAVEAWTDTSSTAAAAAEARHVSSSPSASLAESSRLTLTVEGDVDRLLGDISLLIDRVTTASEGQAGDGACISCIVGPGVADTSRGLAGGCGECGVRGTATGQPVEQNATTAPTSGATTTPSRNCIRAECGRQWQGGSRAEGGSRTAGTADRCTLVYSVRLYMRCNRGPVHSRHRRGSTDGCSASRRQTACRCRKQAAVQSHITSNSTISSHGRTINSRTAVHPALSCAAIAHQLDCSSEWQ